MVKMYSKGFLALSLAFSLAACGNNFDDSKLPDDTTEEQIVKELPGDNDSATDGQDDENTSEEVAQPAPAEPTTPVEPAPAPAPAPAPPANSDRDGVLAKYNHLDPKRIVPTKALADAVAYYDKNLSKIKNKSYLSVINFGQSSKEARFYIINMTSGAVWAIHTSHGKGSDSNHDGYAEKFSNVSGSNASSLGFYMTAETYYGKHGLSLKLDGMSSTNSNARPRAVVIHGADYVQEASKIQGRSWGCPAVTMSYRDKVIGLLKGGSVIYAVK
ncbi:murein L,D-transpeptidase catalytic domain family protein [Bdellovibrio sp. HCB337]|uniref:murein L,D-transpeptidase catalytic domain family protein n=1 Tax=Bdellovibrio sp. HCB337 TaxID=3394358 RepID=UPI0039A6EFC4